MLRIALIGCGEHSQIAHGPSLARLAAERKGEIELIAACDLNLQRAQEFCAQYGFLRPYADMQQMLEKEKPDGCVAVMPVRLIAPIAEKLLRLGIPNLIEKPIGASIEEVRRLAQIAAETKTPHMVSVNRRFLALLNKAKRWTAEKGPLRFISATMLRAKRVEPIFVWETGLHVVDGLRHLVGDLSDFHLQTNGQPPETTAWYSASFRFGNDGMGSLQVLPSCGSSDEVYDLMGEGFRARVTALQNGASTFACWQNGNLQLEEASNPDDPPFVCRGEYAEAAEFIDALRDKRSPRPTIADVLPSSELCARLWKRT